MALFSLIIILFTLLNPYSAYDLSKEKIAHLDGIIEIQRKMAKLHTVGLIITNKNKTIHAKIYGDDNNVNNNTPFIIGSVSKSFTALAILKLKIDINSTLDKFNLEEYIDEESAKKITVGQLLNHTSGLNSFGSKFSYEQGVFGYSNYGYGLLGKIIESKCGKNYHDCMKDLIFNPLGMNNTNANYHEDIIDSYDNFLGFRTKYTGLKSEMGDGFYIPAGFISPTILDMGHYLRLFLNNENEKYKDFKEYTKQMIKKTIKIDDNTYYGMGLFITKKYKQNLIGHSGTTNSFLSMLYIYPDLDLGIFFITNTNDVLCTKPTEELLSNIEKFLVLDYYEGISDSLFFFIHFSYDIIFLIIISIPLTYLIITIIRKRKKKEYTWFKGNKGKIIFGIELFILIIIPLFIIIILYTADPSISYAFSNLRDAKFVVFTSCSLLFLTFLIKLIYVFIFDKHLKSLEIESIPNKDEALYNNNHEYE